MRVPPDLRAAFLSASADDAEIRAEVEALLASAETSVSSPNRPSPGGTGGGPSGSTGNPSAPLGAGHRLGPYEILEMIGAGGMGKVYRARDPRLKRDVAIKILPDEFAENPERMARFQREAEVLASLNHANIAQIYGVEERALVMELVDGATLNGPFLIETALTYAGQIAAALEYAHEKGVVHRDLKPANIKVTREGVVKVLDFGLAKIADPAIAASDPANSPTLTMSTQAGIILGTAAYMSPEQASGQPVDRRTDVWSFGVVLWEMLTGRKLFQAETVSHTLADVLRAQIDFTRLPAETPATIVDLLQRCLDRDTKNRLRDIGEARVAIQRHLLNSASAQEKAASTPARSDPGTRRRRRLPWIWMTGGATAAAAMIWGGVFLYSGRTKPVPGPEHWRQITNFPDSATWPALSRDGRMLAFTRGTGAFLNSRNEIYVKLLPDGPAVQYTHDGRAKIFPTFSPDGSRIAYTVGGFHTWVVPVLAGGQPQLMLSNASGLTWIDSQRILFSEQKRDGMGIETALEDRASEREIYLPYHGMAHVSQVSPDGKQVLVVEMIGTGPWLPCRLLPFGGNSRGRQVGPVPGRCKAAAWSPDGKWMYFEANTSDGDHLWRQRVDDAKPEQITFGSSGQEGLAMAPDGRSLFTSVGTGHPGIWIHDGNGDREISGEGIPSRPYFAPDGAHVYYAVDSPDRGGGELWVTDPNSGRAERALPGMVFKGLTFSLDGKSIVYTTSDKSTWLTTLDHRSPPRKVPLEGVLAIQLSASGTFYFIAREGNTNYFYRMNADGSGRRKVFPEAAATDRISPDEQWSVRRVDTPEESDYTLVARPVRGGRSVPVCKGCLFRWSAGGKAVVLWFRALTGEGGATVAIPLKGRAVLPPLPPNGIQNVQEAAKLPGAVVIPYEFADVSPTMSSYAYLLENVQRNIFQIPLE